MEINDKDKMIITIKICAFRIIHTFFSKEKAKTVLYRLYSDPKIIDCGEKPDRVVFWFE